MITKENLPEVSDSLLQIALKADRADLEKIFVESEIAKQILRDSGYGVIGTSIVSTAQEVADAAQRAKAEANDSLKRAEEHLYHLTVAFGEYTRLREENKELKEQRRVAPNASWRLVNELEREIIRLNQKIHEWQREFHMYRDAWYREIGSRVARKHHDIDAFVLGTRLAFRDARNKALEEAAEIVNGMDLKISERTSPYDAAVNHAVACRDAIKMARIKGDAA